MKIPKDLQFTEPAAATETAIGILQNIPQSWREQLYQAAEGIVLQVEVDFTHERLTSDGLLLLDYTRHLHHISLDDPTTYLVNALAPLFMRPDGSKTDRVRRTFAEGIIKFSRLQFSFGK